MVPIAEGGLAIIVVAQLCDQCYESSLVHLLLMSNCPIETAPVSFFRCELSWTLIIELFIKKLLAEDVTYVRLVSKCIS